MSSADRDSHGITIDDLPDPEFTGKVPVEELRVDGDNPNSMDDDMFGLLCDRIRKRGWVGGPIITDTTGLIADGQHRWMAAKEIGLDKVPVKQYDISDEERRLWRQEMNKIEGEHDEKRDALEFDLLQESDVADDMFDLLDARDESIDEYMDLIHIGPDDQEHEETYDVDHDIYYEECVSGMQEHLGGDSVDCVITDPPYGIDLNLEDTFGSTGVEHQGDLENDGYDDAIRVWKEVVTELKRVLKPDGHLYAFGTWKTYDDFRDILEEEGFEVKNCLVWLKSTPNHQPSFGSGKRNYGYQHEFILYATHEDGDPRPLDRVMSDLILHKHTTDGNVHPTEKPVGLLDILVEQSTDVGDTVLDPFMGSGATGVAAILSERNAVGFEMDDEYKPIIDRRIKDAMRQLKSPSNTDESGTTEEMREKLKEEAPDE